MKNSFILREGISKLFKIGVFFLILSLPLSLLHGAELSSTNYTVKDSMLGSGKQMNSTNFSVSGVLSNSPSGSWSTGSLPLVSGVITSCGKIIASGTYTLGLNLTGISGPCFVVSADSVVINGNGYSVTAVPGNSNYAVIATSSTNGGNGHSVTISNIVFNNFTGGVNANGSNSSSGTGGIGGSISIASSTLGNVISNGGSGNTINNGGVGGTISVTNSVSGSVTSSGSANGAVSVTGVNLNISNNTYTAGTLNLSYSGTLTTTNTNLSALTNLVINSTDLSSYIGGSFPLIPGAINSCGTIYFAGTYTLEGTVTSDCNILHSNAILDGSGNTLIGNVSANSYGVTLSNISVTGVVSTTGASPGSLTVNNSSNLLGSVVVTGVIAGDGTSSFGSTTISTGGSVNANSASFVGDVINNGTINAGNAVSGKTLNNGTINTGAGTFTFNSYSINNGTVNGNTVFGTSSVNVGTVTGTARFNSLTEISGAVSISGATAFGGIGYVNGRISDYLDNEITSWIFNASSTNEGIVKGNATFNNTSRNNGTVLGNSIFNDTTVNAGSITGEADVYYPVSRPLGGTIDGYVTYHQYPGLYFNDSAIGHGVVGKWDDLNNWWTDPACTLHSPVIPTSGDDVIIVVGNIATTTIAASANTATFNNSTSNLITLSVFSTSTRATVFNASSTNVGTITGNATFSGPDTENTGTINGLITREYSVGIYTVVKDFTHNGVHWIIQAINGARVDLSQATYSFLTNTFQTLNNGVFTAWNSLINLGSSGVPDLAITSPSVGTNIKWSPVVSWGTNSLCQYKIDGGSYVSVDCSKSGADIPRPTATSHIIFLKSTDTGGNITEKSVVFTYDNTQPVWTSCGTDLLDEVTRPYYYLTSNVGNCTITASTTLRGDNNGGGSFFSTGSITGAGTTTNVSLVNITATGTVASFNNITVASSTLSGSIVVNGSFNSDIKSIFGNTTVESGGIIYGGMFSGNVLNKVGGQIVNSTSSPVTVVGSVTNNGIINGDFVLNANSTNIGTVNGNLTLKDSSVSIGTVNGDLRFNELTAVSGVISFASSTAFLGTGHVTGSIKDNWRVVITRWVFNDQSSNVGFTVGDSFFNDSSLNASTVSGNAHFSDSSVNAGTVTGTADAYYSVSTPLSGTVGGAITYHSYPNAVSFNDSVGDHNWSNSLNWFTDTTLVVPLGRTPISNEDVVLFASTSLPYSVVSNVYFAESGKTLNGAGYTLTGNISGNGAYGGYNAYNFNLENITVTGTTTSIGGDGIPGISDGGKGGIINIATSSTGGVVVNGGDPLQNGGDAGEATIINSFAVVEGTRILAVGGASVGCGFGGNGGNISLIESSGYILVTATGEDATSTCVVIPPTPPNRSSGSVNVVGVYRPPVSASSLTAGLNSGKGSSGSKAVTTFLNVNTNIGKLNLANLPSVNFTGLFGKNLGVSSFVNVLGGLIKFKPMTRFADLPKLNFSDKLNNFLIGTLPKSLMDISNAVPSIKSAFITSNIVNGYDLYSMSESPINTPTLSDITRDNASIPETLVFVSVNGKERTTKLSIDEKGSAYQIITVNPLSTVSVVFNNAKNKTPKIIFNGKSVAAVNDKNNIKFDIIIPKDNGTYVLSMGNLTLKINVGQEVQKVKDKTEVKNIKSVSLFKRIKNWFSK